MAQEFFDKAGNWTGGNSDILNHMPKKMTPKREKVDGLYQPALIYNRHIKVGFHTESVAFTFTSNVVFFTKEECIGFMPYYVRKLIDAGDLPKDVLNADNSINEKLLLPSVVKLGIGEMEQVKDEG